MAAMASAIPMKLVPIIVEHTQASSYSLKTDHPVHEPAPIIKGVPQPYAVPVPQPYAVPRAIPVEVPRAVPVTVTRTVGVPVIARGEPIVRTRLVQTEAADLSGGEGLSLGGYGGGLSLGGYGGLGDGGYGGGYGGDNGLGLKTLTLGMAEGLSKY